MEPLIFLSATTADLEDACDLVAAMLKDKGVQTRYMNNLHLSGGDLRDVLRRHIDECGMLVQLVGFRYGQEPKTREADAEATSYTQFEAEYARSVGKPVVYIVFHEGYPFKAGASDETEERQARQRAYWDRVRGNEEQRGSVRTKDALRLAVHALDDQLGNLREEAEARYKAQEEASERIGKGVEELRERLADIGAVKVELLPAGPGEGLSWLRYRTQACPHLVGRDEDLRFMRAFRDHEDDFRWSYLTGSGGSGKTRLAWEFVRETLAQEGEGGNWIAGFVRADRLPDGFAAWNPPKDVLLVLDYAGERAEIAKGILEAWLTGPVAGKRRLLLLDRTYHRDFDIAKALVPAGGDALELRTKRYAGELDVLGGLQRGIRPRRLRPLTPEEMGAVFAANVETIRGAAATSAEVEAAVRLFETQWRDKDRHALFAAALGLLVAPGAQIGMSELRRENVLSYLIERQQEVWRRLLPVPTEHDRNLVYAGTLARGLHRPQTDGHARLREGRYRVAAAMAGEAVEDADLRACQGLFPDLLGEAYVAARLRGEALDTADPEAVETWALEILDWALDLPAEAGTKRDEFLALLAQDFLGDAAVGPAFEARFPALGEEVQRAVLRSAFAADAARAERLAGWCQANGREGLLREFGTGAEVRTADAAAEVALIAEPIDERSLVGFLDAVESNLAVLRERRRRAGPRAVASGLEGLAEAMEHPGESQWAADPRFRRLRAVVLNDWSDVRAALGQIAGVLDTLGQALAEFETLVASDPDDPEALRDVSVALSWVGNVRLALGDLTGAGERYERSLEILERVATLGGETPEALQDVSVSLDKVGDVRRALGDLAGAAELYTRALEIRERVAALVGDTPEALRNVSVSLDKVGIVRLALGDLAGAAEQYKRELEIDEHVAALVGDTPEALRDVSVSLNKVGDVRRARGDLAGAAELYERSLETLARVAVLVGETPEALRDISVSLNKAGDVRLALGDLVGAEALYARSLEIAERVAALVGETPEALRDTMASLHRVAFVKHALDDPTTGNAIGRALYLARRLVADYPDVAEHHADLARTEALARELGFDA